MRIKGYFDDVLIKDSERSPSRVTSTWTLIESQDNLFDTFIKIVKLDLLYRDSKPTKQNKKLTKNKHKRLTELSDKTSDKGSAIVVMNTNGYIKVVHNQ